MKKQPLAPFFFWWETLGVELELQPLSQALATQHLECFKITPSSLAMPGGGWGLACEQAVDVGHVQGCIRKGRDSCLYPWK